MKCVHARSTQLLSVLLLTIAPALTYSQGDVSKEVIVLLESTHVSFPAKQVGASLSEVTLDASLASLFEQRGVVTLQKLFPNSTSSGQLRVSRTGTEIQIPDLSNFFVLTLSSSSQVSGLVNDLEGLSGVLLAEPHGIKSDDQCPPGSVPNDPWYQNNFCWQLHNCSLASADVSAADAWALTTGDPSIIISIVDHGVDVNHEDFVGKITGDTTIDPAKPNHGTQVAGMAGAIGNNGIGVVGLDWLCTINAQQTTELTSSRNQGILDAIDAGADIINMSYGGAYSETEHLLLATAYQSDIVLVASAGNDNTSAPWYPGDEYETIRVSGTDDLDNRYTSGNFGPTVDVAAPGVGVYTTKPGDQYGGVTGTSYAAPLVSGLAGLLLSVDPSLEVEDIKGIIRASAVDVNQATFPGEDDYLGTGRIDARAALDRLSAPYALNHRSAGAASQVIPVGGLHSHKFWFTPGLAVGYYTVQRIEYRRNVTFGSQWAIPPDVWGRQETNGYYPGFDITFNVGWCEPVDGTVTKTGCTLRTYVYDVWNTSQGQYEGVFPSEPSNVVFHYSVLGIEDLAAPSVTVNYPNGSPGFPAPPQEFSTLDQVDITWTVVDEYLEGVICNVFLVQDIPGGQAVFDIASTIPVDENGDGTYQWTVPPGWGTVETCKIRVVARDSNFQTGADASDTYFTVHYNTKPPPPPPPDPEGMPASVSYTNYLSVPSPNPFNPSTSVRFGLEQGGPVTLKVFNARGEVVKTIHDRTPFGRGEFSATWDGLSDAGVPVPTGVYFMRIQTVRFSDVVKAVLLK